MRALLALLLVGGCGVTEWQREQDRIAQVRSLHSPDMESAIERALDERNRP